MTIPDLYKLLDLPREATRSAVKVAYRTKAKHAHPDAGGDPDAFRLLKLARDVLCDETKRRLYDETGEFSDQAVERNYEAQVYVAVGEVMLKVLPQVKSPNYENVLALMREWTACHVADLEKRIEDLDRTMEVMAVVANRVQITDGENLLRSIINGRRNDLQGQRETLGREHQLYEKVHDFLDDYQYFTQIENVLISSDIWYSRRG